MTYLPADHDLWGLSDEGPVGGEKYRDNPTYLATKNAVTEILIDLAEEEIPGFREHIVWQEAGTPITQERYTHSTAGGSYGIEMNLRQIGPFRPTPKTDIKGLYLAGASMPWGPGVEGVMLSGVGAAGAVLSRDLFTEIRSGKVFGAVDQLPAKAADGTRSPWRPTPFCAAPKPARPSKATSSATPPEERRTRRASRRSLSRSARRQLNRRKPLPGHGHQHVSGATATGPSDTARG